MREGKAPRILLTGYTLLWLFLLMGLFVFLFENLSYHLGVVWGKDMPGMALTENVAIPMIGGLSYSVPRRGVTWVTWATWTILWGWPLANVVALWRVVDPGRARRAFLYSTMGYGLAFFAFLMALGVGLSAPFMY